MVYFIIVCIVYFAAISGLFFLFHREHEKSLRDRTPVSEEELNKNQSVTRYFSRTGIMLSAQQDGAPVQRRGIGFFVMFAIILLLFAAIGLPCLIVYLVQPRLTPEGYTAITADKFIFSYMAAGAFGFACLYLLPFVFKRTAAVFNKLEQNTSAAKRVAFQNTLVPKVIFILGFIITFPLFALGLNYGAAYNQNEIRYNPFFSPSTVVTTYEKVTAVNRYFNRDNNNKITSAHYIITLKGGYTVDTLFSEPTMQTYEIHGYLKAKNPVLFDNNQSSEPLEDIIKYVESNYQQEAWRRMYFIFDIE